MGSQHALQERGLSSGASRNHRHPKEEGTHCVAGVERWCHGCRQVLKSLLIISPRVWNVKVPAHITELRLCLLTSLCVFEFLTFETGCPLPTLHLANSDLEVLTLMSPTPEEGWDHSSLLPPPGFTSGPLETNSEGISSSSSPLMIGPRFTWCCMFARARNLPLPSKSLPSLQAVLWRPACHC